MRKQSLSPARMQSLEFCQELRFGRIRNLRIRNGDPVMQPLPRAIEEKTFGKENDPQSERVLVDFTLKSHAKDFFAYLDQLQNGVIQELVVKHGLPFQVRRIRH